MVTWYPLCRMSRKGECVMSHVDLQLYTVAKIVVIRRKPHENEELKAQILELKQALDHAEFRFSGIISRLEKDLEFYKFLNSCLREQITELTTKKE